MDVVPSPATIEEIYFEALDLQDRDAQEAFIHQRCGSDLLLRQRIEQLLDARQRRGDFLSSHALEPTSLLATPAGVGPGLSIGPYKLLEEIGEGGMGVVYMAEQARPVRRRVALKVIRPGMDSRQIIVRFEAERQALSLMDHPNIARVLDAGATDGGRPFFVMELVHGMAITDYCDRERLNLAGRLALFTQVCKAVQHAHQRGIIHRDLKASNVLVTVIDGAAVPKVIDFGVAKATGAALTERTLFTGYHQFIGTPAYMSPEQADLSGVDVDTRSDVYSLGVLLYELLTGTTPVDAATLKEAPFDEVRRIVREDEPPRPSARLSTLSDELQSTLSVRRQANPLQLRLAMRGELDWIVMKCLEKDRNRRYESASALAADVQCYLDEEPVAACPPSTLYRVRKLARKHRAALASVGLFALLLVVGTGVSAWLAIEARQARQLAERRTESEAAARLLAEANLRRGNEAVEVLLSRVATERLLDQPHLEELRRALLTDALRLNQSLLTENRDNATAQFEAAKAYRRMAEIQDHLGAPEEAARAARQSIRISENLSAEEPADTRYQAELAKGYRILSMSRFNGGSGPTNEDEHAVHRRVLVLYEELLTRSPDDPDVLLAAAGARNIIAFSMPVEQVAESDALFEQALNMGKTLVSRFPDRLDFAEHVARTHWFWGRVLHRRQDYARAREELSIALAESTQLSTRAPNTAAFRKTQVEVLISLTQLGIATSDPNSKVYAREAHQLASALVSDYPTNLAYDSMRQLASQQMSLSNETEK